jgi:Piezo non-specific cation channel, R-Ras-binding domain
VACELGLARERRRAWWRLRCRALDAAGLPLMAPSPPPQPLSPPAPRTPPAHLAIPDAIHAACPPPLAAGPSSGADAAGEGWGPPTLVAAIERVQTGFLGETLSSVGITGLYVTLIFGLGRFLRLALTNLRMRIPYQDLPNVAHLVTLCNDIAVAREEREMLLEEQLFYSLLNIYRSPAVLFELTKKDR